MTAHIAIRPLHTPRIAVICRACALTTPYDRHRPAHEAAQAHNRAQHPKAAS